MFFTIIDYLLVTIIDIIILAIFFQHLLRVFCQRGSRFFLPEHDSPPHLLLCSSRQLQPCLEQYSLPFECSCLHRFIRCRTTKVCRAQERSRRGWHEKIRQGSRVEEDAEFRRCRGGRHERKSPCWRPLRMQGGIFWSMWLEITETICIPFLYVS